MCNSTNIPSIQMSKQELIDEIDYLRGKIASTKTTEKFSPKLHQTLSNKIIIGYWEWDEIANRPTYLSKEMADIMGMSPQSLYEQYQCESDFFNFIHAEDLEHYRNNLSVVLNPRNPTGRAHSFEYRIIRPNGEVRHILELEFGIQEENGVFVRTYGVIQDITDHLESIRALEQSEQRYRSLFSQLPIGVQELDWSSIKKAVDRLQSEGVDNLKEYFLSNPLELQELVNSTVVSSANAALLDIYGNQTVEEYIQYEGDVAHWWSSEWVDHFASEIAALAGPDQIHFRELADTRMDDTVFEARLITRIVEGDENTWERVLTTVEDVTERREVLKKLNHQASHDPLTGLINRTEFENRLQRLLHTLAQNKEEHALCFMDLDQFKVINDTCGHIAGDELLKQLGQVLQTAVRHRDTLARLGGDEFGVLMEHCSLEQAQRVANALLQDIRDFQFSWEGQSFRVGASIGLVSINDTMLNPTELMKQADAACYMAKDLGRNRIHTYRPDDSELARRQGEMQWVSRINQALEENRFCFFAQAITPLNGGTEQHYELLLRMLGDQGEIIVPGAFLPAAERYGLIEKLDNWVIQNAFTLLAAQPDFLNQVQFISINLSGPSLNNGAFLNTIITQLMAARIEANKICFEITETVAISNLSAALTFIETLKQVGCRFALDDFGSGLSSFGYLKKLPVDYLKIDGMFVKDIVKDPIDRAMVKSIHDIGQVMGMQTIAEFVETDEIKNILAEMGVNYAQGYGIEKPRPLDELLSDPKIYTDNPKKDNNQS